MPPRSRPTGVAFLPVVAFAVLVPHLGEACGRLATVAAPYGPTLDTALADVALLAAAAATGWLTVLTAIAYAFRLARRPVPAILLLLAPRVWRPVVAAAAGAAVLAASPAAAMSTPDSARATGSEGGAASSLTAAPPASRLAGLPLPDRPGDAALGRRDARLPRAGAPSPARAASDRHEARERDETRAPSTARGETTAAGPSTGTAGTAAPRPRRQTYEVRVGDSLWGIAADSLRTAGVRATRDRTDREWRRWYAANRAAIGPDPDTLRAGLTLREPRTDPAPPDAPAPHLDPAQHTDGGPRR
ncbi:LysM peptidoglycan-binding domain-containing protein [Mumia sp. Pv 4-285]|uniref:LysM peptidoglycan-binding domain-containing protein n=1 Tax=Mumia qirimensis TaxID=3234852 RepID=UPI00351CBC7C